MGLVPQTMGLQTLHSMSWNDLQSKRRNLGQAWALWSLMPDSMPQLSSSRPQAASIGAKAEHAGSRGLLTLGDAHSWASHMCAWGLLLGGGVPYHSKTKVSCGGLPRRNPVPAACREHGQDRPGPRRSDFRKVYKHTEATFISMCNWNPRRRKIGI